MAIGSGMHSTYQAGNLMASPASMRSPRDQFLNQLTGIDREFNDWKSWQLLMDWLKRQPWHDELFGGEKIPGRLLHYSILANEVSKYLGGPEERV